MPFQVTASGSDILPATSKYSHDHICMAGSQQPHALIAAKCNNVRPGSLPGLGCPVLMYLDSSQQLQESRPRQGFMYAAFSYHHWQQSLRGSVQGLQPERQRQHFSAGSQEGIVQPMISRARNCSKKLLPGIAYESRAYSGRCSEAPRLIPVNSVACQNRLTPVSPARVAASWQQAQLHTQQPSQPCQAADHLITHA